MRRFIFGVVIASITAAMPAWALAGDREIAKAVMAELQQQQAAGNLKGFDIDMQVKGGVVYLEGHVVSPAQRSLVAQAAAKAVGQGNLVNNIEVEQSDSYAVQPVASYAPSQPASNDEMLTDSIIDQLSRLKNAGHLRGFDLDVSTVNGDVWLRGNVSSQAQKAMILDVARHTRGVSRVVDDVKVDGAVRQASTGIPAPVPQASSMPVAAQPQPVPQSAGSYSGQPVPMNMNGGTVAYGMGAPRYDQPNMPNYAWPSYAAHPNYAAVTYPKQYSPSAWPYIGPFYPYPQVPLGWRKVALEWDDGLWYLDFTSK